MLHGVQGGYYWKAFGKHGPLHNPHAYGYFDHVPHAGLHGRPRHRRRHRLPGRRASRRRSATSTSPPTCSATASTGTTSSRDGSTFRTRHGGDLLAGQRHLVRPERRDARARRRASTSPTGTTSAPPIPTRTPTGTAATAASTASRRRGRSRYAGGDLAQAAARRSWSTLLSHPNDWYVREARRVLADRRDPEVDLPAARAGDGSRRTSSSPWKRCGRCTSAAASTSASPASFSTTPTRTSAAGRSACSAMRARCHRDDWPRARRPRRPRAERRRPQPAGLLGAAVARRRSALPHRRRRCCGATTDATTRTSRCCCGGPSSSTSPRPRGDRRHVLRLAGRRWQSRSAREVDPAARWCAASARPARPTTSPPAPGCCVARSDGAALARGARRGAARPPGRQAGRPGALSASSPTAWSDDTTDADLIQLFMRLDRPAGHGAAPSPWSRDGSARSRGAWPHAGGAGRARASRRAPPHPEAARRPASRRPSRPAAIDALARFDDAAVAAVAARPLPAAAGAGEGQRAAGAAGPAELGGPVRAGRRDANRSTPTEVTPEELRPLALHGDRQTRRPRPQAVGQRRAATPEEKLAEVRRLNNDLRAAAGDADAPARRCYKQPAPPATGSSARAARSAPT